jgi:hypothetical protein
LTLRATRDTFIDVDEPTETNGDEAVLEVENDPPETKQALIGFDVTGLSEGVVINEAIMRLTLVTPHETPISVHDVIGEWSEAATSASNAPLLGDLITMIDPPEPGDVFVEADVTDAITGDGPVSFYLIPGTEIVEGDFAARESASGVPILILRWDP